MDFSASLARAIAGYFTTKCEHAIEHAVIGLLRCFGSSARDGLRKIASNSPKIHCPWARSLALNQRIKPNTAAIQITLQFWNCEIVRCGIGDERTLNIRDQSILNKQASLFDIDSHSINWPAAIAVEFQACIDA